MTNIDIDNEVYKAWVIFYETQDRIEYPTLKNFTTKKIIHIIKKGGSNASRTVN